MVGYVKDSTAVVDEMFQTDELSRYLARMNLAPQWEAVSYTHLDVYKRQSHDAMTEAVSRLDEASRTGKTEIVEIKSVIANLPSYLSGLDPDSRTQLAQLNQLSSIIAKMDRCV